MKTEKDVINDLMIAPVLKYRPDGIEEEAFLAWIWGVATRILSSYRADRGCRVPGIYLENGIHPASGYKNPRRLVSRNELLVARIDDTAPDVVEVDNAGHVFRLTKAEWDKFRRKHLRICDHQEEI